MHRSKRAVILARIVHESLCANRQESLCITREHRNNGRTHNAGQHAGDTSSIDPEHGDHRSRGRISL